MNNDGTEVKTTAGLMLLNARSIRNKDHIIIAELENNKIRKSSTCRNLDKVKSTRLSLAQPIQIQTGQLWYHHTQLTRGQERGRCSNSIQKRIGWSMTWSQQHTDQGILHMEVH